MEQRTKEWYCNVGWKLLNEWLSQFAAKGYQKVYPENIGVPDWADKKTIIQMFNEDAQSWVLGMDGDGDLLCRQTTNRKN